MRFVLTLTIALALLGCAGGPEPIVLDEMTDRYVEVMAGMAVREIAYEVCRIDDQELTDAIVNLYTTVRDGALTDDAIDQLSRLTAGRPTLGPAIGDLVELFGQPILEGYEPVLLTRPMLQRIENKWAEGFRLCGLGGPPPEPVPIPGPLNRE